MFSRIIAVVGRPVRIFPALCLTAFCLSILCLTAFGPAALGRSADAGAFSGERAMAWLEYQCAIGPRHPGSPGHLELQAAIAAHADSLGLTCIPQRFTAPNPAGEGSFDYCNLVVSAGPEGGRRIWIGAHYDTRPFCDRESDPQRAALPLPGANDGASGTAILMHLAELLAADPPDIGVDLLFFDGEDGGLAGDPSGFCLGSAHMAANWDGFGSPLAGRRPRGLIVLDMVGERGVRIPMEAISLHEAPAWGEAVFERAADLGLDAFDPAPGPAVFDDHVPFLRAGIPAVDLIDFEFPQWHTNGDVPAICSPASLGQVGTLVLDLIRSPIP